ncbi:exported hypothetical protein [Nostocoides australiense Ben110]|uniref:Uncharacterized protein n=1 Tax=Nostocoides australiense Ben110 TaxID=1193182 RepID=W6K2I3_9MICO|nr:exported hypothetical protein [Tetrasphaera australiensis Ben110]
MVRQVFRRALAFALRSPAGPAPWPPSPSREHQAVVAATLVGLESSCPPAFRCLTGPLDHLLAWDLVDGDYVQVGTSWGR